MKKLKLNIEELKVESFNINEKDSQGGIVANHPTPYTGCLETCGISVCNECLTDGGTCNNTCNNTCANTCGNTCANTCGNTCGYSVGQICHTEDICQTNPRNFCITDAHQIC